MAVQAILPEEEMVLDELQALVVDQQKVVRDVTSFSTVLSQCMFFHICTHLHSNSLAMCMKCP